MDEKALLFGVLTKTLNRSEDELTGLIYQTVDGKTTIKESALDELLDEDVHRVDKIKKSAKPDEERLKNEYSRGKKETMEEFEKEIKKKFSVESDKRGIELIDEAITANVKAKTGKKEITDDDVKAHKLYIELEKNSVPKTKHEQVIKEFDEYKGTAARKELMTNVRRDALKVLHAMNPVISENPEVAATREQDFLAKFEQYDFELDEQGNHLVKKGDKRMEDKHGHVVPFTDFVKNIAALNYDFKKQDGKGNAGNKDNAQSKGSVAIPKNVEEFIKQYFSAKTPDERVAIKKAWDESQK